VKESRLGGSWQLIFYEEVRLSKAVLEGIILSFTDTMILMHLETK